ncbi:MAG: efflux RND transporter periplasmic adaptor subunit [Gammaproteobacteria bacterium]
MYRLEMTSRTPAASALLATVLLALAGCSQGGQDAGGPGRGPGDRPLGSGGPPPAEVLVANGQVRAFGAALEAVGTALARESVDITSKVANTVTAIRFQEGQRVAAGSVLVELDRAQVAAALAEAEASLLESRNQFNRGRDLSVTQALSRAQLDQLETAVKTGDARVAAARSRLSDTVIRAPFAGRTGLRRISLGSLVSPGTVITTLDDTSVIKLEFTVPQSFLGGLAPGLPIEARADGFGDRVFAGKLTTLDSRIDPVTRSIAVRAELPNADGAIKPGLFMTVRLRAQTAQTLMIPEEALVPEQGRTYVFVVQDGKAKRLEVRTGGREPGFVAVLDGLTAQDLLIVEGTQRVRDGGAVIAKPRA